MTVCDLPNLSHSARSLALWTLRIAGHERFSFGAWIQIYLGCREVRALFLVTVAFCSVMANAACVRKLRTVNDNFFFVKSKSGANRPRSADPIQALVTPQLSDSVSEASGPRPKNVLSNVEILEENSTISSLLRKAETNPADASIHSQLGRAYHEFRLYDEALRHYQNALRLEPDNPIHYEQTGRLYRDWQSPHVAVDLLKKALELAPDFVEAWNTLGTIYERQGNSKEAQDAYLRALTFNSNLDYVHNNLSFSYLQQGKVEQAIHHGERATQLNPTMLIAHNNLGLAYGMLGNLDRSFEELRRGGDEATARNNLGLILLKRGQITESMEQFRLATQIRPFYMDAAANYRRAREMNLQRAREARGRLRFFDRQAAMEADPGAFALTGIENVKPWFLDGTLDLLASQPSTLHPGRSSVEIDIETPFAHPPDQREFGELLGTNFRLGRLLVVPGRPKHTTVFYKEGYLQGALELAHRIPGNQEVLRARSSNSGASIRLRLGLDFGRVAKKQSQAKQTKQYATAALNGAVGKQR